MWFRDGPDPKVPTAVALRKEQDTPKGQRKHSLAFKAVVPIEAVKGEEMVA